MEVRNPSADRLCAVIIGAQKAGTTSFLRYLGQHPDVAIHQTVECAYFLDDAEYGYGWESARRRYYAPGGGAKLVAKSAGLYMKDSALQRLAEHNPECLVILMLRDPTERAWSSYRMERDSGNNYWSDRPFEEVMTAADDQSHPWNRLFLQMGDYASALDRVRRYFRHEQILTVIYEEFVADAQAACREVFRELAVDRDVPVDTSQIYNRRRQLRSQQYQSSLRRLRTSRGRFRPAVKRILPYSVFTAIGSVLIAANESAPLIEELNPEVREFLDAFYRPRNRALESMLGRTLPW